MWKEMRTIGWKGGQMQEGTWEEIDEKNRCGRKLQRGDEKEKKIQEGVLTLGIGIDKNLRMPVLLLISCID